MYESNAGIKIFTDTDINDQQQGNEHPQISTESEFFNLEISSFFRFFKEMVMNLKKCKNILFYKKLPFEIAFNFGIYR